jgi:Caspase domain
MRPQSIRGFAIVCGCLGLCVSAEAYSQTRRALLIGINHYAPPPGAKPATPAPPHAPDSRFAPGRSWTNLQGPLNDVGRIKFLLTDVYGFSVIHELKDEEATRRQILNAIDQLIAETHPGDTDVIYYAGHGSRRTDTLSSKNHFDETIVPVDAWQGAEDIRDKELALRFNQIVYDKHAHLSAIFDSCNSGTIARGVTKSVVRALPYDDRDVAEEKRRDPTTIVEGDLKQRPQDGDAIIVAAATSDEEATEALYSDDLQYHGAFTRALVQVLQANTQPLSAGDVIAQVSALLHADPKLAQQPSVEGQARQSLFGDPVAAHALHVHVTGTSPEGITLDLGSAAGFDVGTQFRAVEARSDEQRTTIEVARIDEQLKSTARVISGPSSVMVGETFELTRMSYPRAARLALFASQSESDPSAATAKVKGLFPGLSWVADPTDAPIDFLVVEGPDGWAAYDQNGRREGPGTQAKGAAFLLLGPPAPLRATIEQSPPFQQGAFAFTDKLAEADYLLAARQRADGVSEYALIDPRVLAAHKPDAWVRSSEEDDRDAALTRGTPPEVVCRNESSFPVRTPWLPQDESSGSNALVQALSRRMILLGKLHSWLHTPARAPGVAHWPYRLEISKPDAGSRVTGILHLNQEYVVRLVTTADRLAKDPPVPRYAYLLGFDCAANPHLLYPAGNLNGDTTIPEPDKSGAFPLTVVLPLAPSQSIPITAPLGADTLVLLLTAEKLLDSSALTADGMIDQKRGASAIDAMLGDRRGAGTRGRPPSNWLVQQLVVQSRP